MTVARALLSLLPLAILVASAEVVVNSNLIPVIGDALPILKLGDPASLDGDIFETILKNASPGAAFQDDGNGTLSAYNGEILAGFFNKTSGETRVFGTARVRLPKA